MPSLTLLLIQIQLIIIRISAFHVAVHPHTSRIIVRNTLSPTIPTVENENFEYASPYHLQAIASAGLNTTELHTVLSSISLGCMNEGISFSTDGIKSKEVSAVDNSMPGATGRVVLLSTHNKYEDVDEDDDEWLLPIRYCISEYMDKALFEIDNNGLDQPVLLCFRPHDENVSSEAIDLAVLIKEEAEEYELCKPLAKSDDSITELDSSGVQYIPSSWIEIDGAMVPNNMDEGTSSSDNSTRFDTSTIMVFDDLIDDELRQGLLNVVLGNNKEWNDIENGPDPERWIYGGLSDVPNEDEHTNSRGLSSDAIIDLCYNEDHTPIKELESRLTNLFPQFLVSRLPEAILGDSVSPLTANAPTHGESFHFHIDADPNLCPPSPWTDIFNRYPNRTPGKPRFMSFLIYLNEEWDVDFGATTQFMDPITKEVHEVMPIPGRCVLSDQDIIHSVTAPTDAAGCRPRYSIVWKLILHPTVVGQDMKDLFLSGRQSSYPKPTFVGSAAASFA